MHGKRPFRSYFIGGFECSTQRRNDGCRLDMLQATRHDVHAASDYSVLQTQDIHTVRDGVRWHRIEDTSGAFDWSSVTGMALAARRTGTQVIWDLCHYGWPDHLDVWSLDFPERFARFAAATVAYLADTIGEAPWICPVNEISYVAYLAAETGRFHPSTFGRGNELKRQLARSSIAAIEAIRSVVPETSFICAEPLVRVIPGQDFAATAHAANGYTRAQFDALDMILGRIEPELGGNPTFIDVVGVNYYPDNQWTMDGHTLYFGHHDYKPLHQMLVEVARRYEKPLLISETSAEGSARAPWLHYVAQEAALAREANAEVTGICLYPVVDYPGWENERPCPVGLLGAGMPRGIHGPLADELRRQRELQAGEARPVAILRRGALMPGHLSGAARFVGYYLWKRRWQFALLALIVIAAAAASVGAQVCMKLAVDGMSGRDVSRVWAAIAAFVGLIVVENVFWRSSGWLGCRATVASGVDMRLDLLRYLGGHGMQFFHDRLAGALSQRLTGTAGNFGALVNTAVWRVVPPCVDFAGAMIVFWALSPRVALELSLFVLAGTLLLTTLARRGRPRHQAYAAAANEVSGRLTDAIANMWSLKAFGAVRRYSEHLREAFGNEARLQRRSWMFMEWTRLLHDVLLWLLAGWVLTTFVALWARGEATAGDVVMTSALTFRVLHGSRDMSLALAEMAQHLAFIGETIGEIGQPYRVPDPAHAVAQVPTTLSLTFEHVTFAYDGKQPAIDDLSLAIETGERVGVVGASGAGKSTLVALVQRLHDPTSGRILLGGTPIDRLKQDDLRAYLGVVPQEISLFHATIRENLQFAKPDANESELIAAARAAYCHDFISAMPRGYDTLVGEHGVKLSGGQRQRLGIARVLLKNAPILVLDEATSALDAESEMHIRNALAELMRGRTIIAITHRVSTLAHFDRIVVMHDGRIVEHGTTQELMRGGGLFQRMLRRQLMLAG